MTDRRDPDPARPGGPELIDLAEPPTRARPRAPGASEVIGNALVGFDYAVFRATKPPAILVEAAKPVRGLSGEGGRLLSIEFPEEVSDDDPTSGAPRRPGVG